MDKKRAAELIPVFQAIADGKEIQERWHKSDEWRDLVGPPLWESENYSYRAKPEPRVAREFWVNVYLDGEIGNAFTSAKSARSGCSYEHSVRQTLFREVLDE